MQNLKENCRRAFGSGYQYSGVEWARIKDSSWFARVVAKLRVDPCLDNSEVEINEAPFNLKQARLLHTAVLIGDLHMVQKILDTCSEPNEAHIDSCISERCERWAKWARYSALDLAIVVGESNIVDALLQKNAKVNTNIRGSLHLAVLYRHIEKLEKTSKIIQSLVHHCINMKAKDTCGYSTFYIAAVALGRRDTVLQLLEWQDKILLNEGCGKGRPPIQIAYEEGFNDIEIALMRCNDVKWFIDSTIREQQGYVDISNVILVGVAFIANATYICLMVAIAIELHIISW